MSVKLFQTLYIFSLSMFYTFANVIIPKTKSTIAYKIIKYFETSTDDFYTLTDAQYDIKAKNNVITTNGMIALEKSLSTSIPLPEQVCLTQLFNNITKI